MEKKTEIVTFRTDSETLNRIKEIAEAKDWTTAKTVDKICKEYFKIKDQCKGV